VDALIVIDVQNDFLAGGPLAVPRGDEVIEPINRLLKRFSICAATMDWHPRDHVSFAATHPGKKPFDRVLVDGREQVLWPTHCVQGTPGAAPPRSLNTDRILHVTRKGTDPGIDSYSGFFDNGHRRSTDLNAYLASRKVQRLFLCGLALDYCVKFTALDAVRLKFDVVVIEDACRAIAIEPVDYERTLGELRSAGVSISSERSVVMA